MVLHIPKKGKYFSTWILALKAHSGTNYSPAENGGGRQPFKTTKQKLETLETLPFNFKNCSHEVIGY